MLCSLFFNLLYTEIEIFLAFNFGHSGSVFQYTYSVKGMMSVWGSHRTVRGVCGCRLRGGCPCGMYLWSPCQQLTGYGGGEYVPDASTRPLPHFRGELGTIGNHKVLQAVGTRPRELLVIWKVKRGKKDRKMELGKWHGEVIYYTKIFSFQNFYAIFNF